jgi:hypothetical protein
MTGESGKMDDWGVDAATNKNASNVPRSQVEEKEAVHAASI